MENTTSVVIYNVNVVFATDISASCFSLFTFLCYYAVLFYI